MNIWNVVNDCTKHSFLVQNLFDELKWTVFELIVIFNLAIFPYCAQKEKKFIVMMAMEKYLHKNLLFCNKINSEFYLLKETKWTPKISNALYV